MRSTISIGVAAEAGVAAGVISTKVSGVTAGVVGVRIPLDPIACSGRTRSLVPEDPIT